MFEVLLLKEGIHADAEVINAMFNRCPARCSLALQMNSSKIAAELYRDAEKFPYLNTTMNLREVNGIEIDDSPPIDYGEKLLTCFKSGYLRLMKISTESETNRITRFMSLLKERELKLHPNIISCEALNINDKYFVVMPKYPATLVNLPKWHMWKPLETLV